MGPLRFRRVSDAMSQKARSFIPSLRDGRHRLITIPALKGRATINATLRVA